MTALCYSSAALLTVALALALSLTPAAARFLCPECGRSAWRVPRAAWPALAWWILMSTIVNYSAQMWAIKHSSPTLVTSFAALQPPLAAALSETLVWLRPALECGSNDAARRCLARDPTASLSTRQKPREKTTTTRRRPTLLDVTAAAAIVAGLYFVVGTEHGLDVDKRAPTSPINDARADDQEDVSALLDESPTRTETPPGQPGLSPRQTLRA